jgi:hypothetical protein
MNRIITNGTGAGGKLTNENGLSYENITNILNYFSVYETITDKNINYYIIDIDKKKYIYLQKKNLEKFLFKDYNKLEKSLYPDEAFIDIENNKLFILEKKFQQTSGSVDEKIQTGLFKKEFYKELYPNYEIYYAYVLSDWFKNPKYLPEFRFLSKYNICIFYGNDSNYFINIKKWLLS